MTRARNRLVTNKAAVQQSQFTRLTFNLKTTKASLRHETMEGREYLVAPCVMLTEGVHNGSQGPLYYPADELAKFPGIWNTRPVVVYHPTENGQGVSAADPVVFDKQRVGLLMNTRFEDSKLKTECWMEPTRLEAVDERVLNSLESEEVVEVSTGLYTDNEMAEGEWNGKKYKAIARNYRPDHLAILPDQKGACSIEDGAGLLRNQAGGNGPEALLAKSLMATFNKLSHSDIWKRLNDKIRPAGSEISDAWVIEVWDKFFIYEKAQNTYYQKYSVKDGEVKLEGVRQEAMKKTSYKLADGSVVGNVKGEGMPKVLKNMEGKMDKEKVVNQLIANTSSPWGEEDRDTLMGMSEEQLTLLNQLNQNAEAGEGEKKEEKKPEGEPAPAPAAAPAPAPATPPAEAPQQNAAAAPQTVEQYIATAPVEMQGVLRAGLMAHNAEKAKLISTITANERNTFTREMLAAKDLVELKALASLAQEQKAAPVGAVPTFVGMGEPAPTGNGQKQEPLVAPTMNFGKDE